MQQEFINDFGKYPRWVISCTHNKIAQCDINSLTLIFITSRMLSIGSRNSGAEPTPGRELQLPRQGCQTREMCLLKYSYSLLWLSGSKPSKLCCYICKALRGNDAENLKTEENVKEVDYTHMADSSTHRQSRCTCLCYYNHFVQSRWKNGGANQSIGIWGEKRFLLKTNRCRLLHSKNRAQLRHLAKTEELSYRWNKRKKYL